MIGVVLWIGIVAAAAGVFSMIIGGKISGRGFGPAFLTVFHDWQPRDKQEAITQTIEEKAGKKQAEQGTGLTAGQSEKNKMEEDELQ